MQIVLIPSQALSCVFTDVLKFSTGFLIICPNTTTTTFTALEPSATSLPDNRTKRRFSEWYSRQILKNWSMGGPERKGWIFHAGQYNSLKCPVCRCQMVHFGYEEKNCSWSELLPERLGRIFHSREWEVSVCLRTVSWSACTIWISAFISLPEL